MTVSIEWLWLAPPAANIKIAKGERQSVMLKHCTLLVFDARFGRRARRGGR